jgi:hypothetical protein
MIAKCIISYDFIKWQQRPVKVLGTNAPNRARESMLTGLILNVINNLILAYKGSFVIIFRHL